MCALVTAADQAWKAFTFVYDLVTRGMTAEDGEIPDDPLVMKELTESQWA